MMQQRQQAGGGPDRNPPGYNNEVGRAMGPIMDLPPPDPNATIYDRDWPPRGPMAPGGGPIQIGKPRPGPGTFPPSGGGGIPPWKSRRRIAPPPGKFPGGSGPIYGGPGESGPMIPGGPRVPPNLQGYLQKMRMQNRPPANVGGGANRVGMQDQQGGMARALQRGTGRPPMSRRSAFGRAGRTR